MSVHKPKFFITGGQVGADSIPLEVASDLGVQVRGWMPKGFKRDDGRGEEIAETHGLLECEGGFSVRDQMNAEKSDALLAFLTSEPNTGRGTMQTAGLFIRDAYRTGGKSWIPIARPVDMDEDVAFEFYGPVGTIPYAYPTPSVKPLMVIWDLDESNVEAFAPRVRMFLNWTKPKTLMFSGPTLKTDPDILKNGVALMKQVFRK